MGSSPEITDVALANVTTREDKTTWKQNKNCIFYCLVVSLACFQYGLDLAVVNSAQSMKGFLIVFGFPSEKASVGYGISTQFQQAITSLMNVGVIIGSLGIEPAASFLGRRRSYIVAAAWAFLGVTIVVASTNKGAVIFGRFCIGVSNALFIGLTTIYISEASPAHLRGSLVTCQQLTVCIGTVIGQVVVNAMKTNITRLSYQIPAIILYGIPVFLCVAVWFIPESPRWLLLNDREEDANHHLKRLRGSTFPPELVAAELFAIKDAIAAEREITLSKWSAMRLMFSKTERTRTLLTFAACTFHGASGFPFLSSYSTYFFQIAGATDAFIDGVIITTISLIGAGAGIVAHRYIGRRPMLLAAFGSQAVLMLVIGAVWSAIPGTQVAGKVVVSMCVIFQCLYAAGCGPMLFICGGEIPNNRLRAVTFGVGTSIGFFFNFIISLTTPYFINPEALNIGPKVGYIWFASNMITLVFVYLCFPETHRRSLEDIDELFYAKVPLRKFKQYKCTGIVHEEDVVINEKAGAHEVHVEDVVSPETRAT